MSEWITDRRPMVNDAHCGFVWITTERGDVFREIWKDVCDQPWMPITPPEPYVKPKRYEVVDGNTEYYVNEKRGQVTWATVPVRDDDYDRAKEAAERIAAIYEEVMP